MLRIACTEQITLSMIIVSSHSYVLKWFGQESIPSCSDPLHCQAQAPPSSFCSPRRKWCTAKPALLTSLLLVDLPSSFRAEEAAGSTPMHDMLFVNVLGAFTCYCFRRGPPRFSPRQAGLHIHRAFPLRTMTIHAQFGLRPSSGREQQRLFSICCC